VIVAKLTLVIFVFLAVIFAIREARSRP